MGRYIVDFLCAVGGRVETDTLYYSPLPRAGEESKIVMHLILADLILVTHALFVAFVVLGLVAILPGRHWRWGWVRNWWFRVLHLLAIVIVIAESWMGLVCPFTEWENRSREAAGGSAYASSFIQHWLHEVLFYDFAPWVFTVAYTVFGILVIIAWLLMPPRCTRN